jgi:DNA-binding NtrC family response regulator
VEHCVIMWPPACSVESAVPASPHLASHGTSFHAVYGNTLERAMNLQPYRILFVDDDSLNLMSTRMLLEQWGYQVDTASSGDEALGKIRDSSVEYAVVLMDYNMPGKAGSAVAREILAINREVLILFYSGEGSREVLKDTFRAGAVDFIEKGQDNIAQLRQAIQNACERYEKTTRTLKAGKSKTANETKIGAIGMIGQSDQLAQASDEVLLAQGSRKNVLVLGESGVGKELVAQAIHGESNLPFLPINCAAFAHDGNLLESTLFGHEKGAFTGAIQRKSGVFEAARGGTVFLDEIHHLSLTAQAQILRATQEKKVRRMGANDEYEVDFRLIAATKADIMDRVKRGEFLLDLYYRLNVLTIEIAPLRERPEDIAPLVQFFCKKHEKETGQKKAFLMETIRLFERHDWPGNVRELDGMVSTLLTRSESDTIGPSQLKEDFRAKLESTPTQTIPEVQGRHEIEIRKLILATAKTSRSGAHAAKRLDMKPTTLYSMMDRLGIEKTFSL